MKAKNIQGGVQRPQQNLGNVRKALDLDSISHIERMLNTFIQLCDEHPELVKEYHFGAFLKGQTDEADAGERKGSTTEDMIRFYRNSAQYIIEDVLLGRCKSPRKP